jgi:hypothetical protein
MEADHMKLKIVIFVALAVFAIVGKVVMFRHSLTSSPPLAEKP